VSALFLHSHPNPDLAGQYLRTVQRQLKGAEYRVDLVEQRYNGWLLRVQR
jgi:hypothetical protein